MPRLVAVSVLGTLAGCDVAFDLDRGIEACPETYAKIGVSKSSYRFVTTENDWIGAHDACRADTESGVTHLVVFETTAEIAAVQAEFPLTVETYVGYARAFDEDPDVFRAVTGEPLVRGDVLWQMGEPNNAEGTVPESAVIIRETERLSDAKMTFRAHSICECDGVATPITFEPP